MVFARTGSPVETIQSALANAASNIDVAIYSFSDARLKDAILKASGRGVKVRLILNKAKNYTAFANALERAKVDVRYVNTVMHHKFAIIDGPQTADADPNAGVLLSGSCNWTKSAFSRYDEDLLLIQKESALLIAFQREFNRLWGHSREFGKSFYKPSHAPELPKVDAVFTSQNMRAYQYRGENSFGPAVALTKGVCGKRLIAAIDGAKKQIAIAATHYRRGDLDRALQAAHQRGVEIRILLDGQEYHGASTSIPDSQHDEQLAKRGVPVRYKIYSRRWDYRTAKQMHCKFMIVDNRLVLTGSLNWSANSELKTMENLVGVHDQDVVKQYAQRFDAMWDYGKGKLQPLISRLKSSSRSKRQTFPPMSLEASDIERLLAAYE